MATSGSRGQPGRRAPAPARPPRSPPSPPLFLCPSPHPSSPQLSSLSLSPLLLPALSLPLLRLHPHSLLPASCLLSLGLVPTLVPPFPVGAKLPSRIPSSAGQGGGHPQPQTAEGLPLGPTGPRSPHLPTLPGSASLAPVQPQGGEQSSGARRGPPALGPFFPHCLLPWGSLVPPGPAGALEESSACLSPHLFSPEHSEYPLLLVPASNFCPKRGSDFDSAMPAPLSEKRAISLLRPHCPSLTTKESPVHQSNLFSELPSHGVY